MNKSLLALSLIAATSAASAQSVPYAKISVVSGQVSVSAKNQITAAKTGMSLSQGSYVLASRTGSATIQFANGCSVVVKPGESLAVTAGECSAVHARNVGTGRAASVATGGVGSLSTEESIGLAALGILVVVAVTNNDDGTTTVTGTTATGATVTATAPTPAPSPSPAPSPAPAPAPAPVSGA